MNKRLEDILVWVLTGLMLVGFLYFADKIFSSNWFWESLKIIIPVGLVSCVVYYQFKKFK